MLLSVFLTIGLWNACLAVAPLGLRYGWKFMDYDFPTQEHRERALRDQFYVPENNLPVGIEIWKDKMFVTVPRWNSKGIPSTLNYVPLDDVNNESPLLRPYPDWETNQQGNCEGITTTYRVRVDECDRLWVLDSGTVGIGNTTQQVCPYALHAFDLKTNRHILRYQYKDTDTNANTFIANIAIEVGDTCADTHVYASDELGYGLVVYSLKDNDSWRFTHGFFHPDPLRGDFNIDKKNFQWEAEGIFGMALSPKVYKQERVLFFHPLASHREFMVPTQVLKAGPNENAYQMFVPLGERTGHSTAELMTDDGLMLFNLIDSNSVGCWDWNSPYSAEYHDVVAKDDERLIFPSDVRVAYGFVWIMSDQMSNYLEAPPLNFTQVNFRVVLVPLEEAIAGTKCDRRRSLGYNNYHQSSQY